MGLTRRQFLTLIGGSTGAAVLFQACGVPPEELLVESSYEMPEDMVSGLDNWYATTDANSPVSNGLIVRIMEGRAKKIEGNIDFPINEGKHSAVCEASLQSLYHPDRIKGPLLRVGNRGEGKFEEISWDNAIDRLSSELKKLKDSGESAKMVFATKPLNSQINSIVSNFTTSFGGNHVIHEPLEQTTLKNAFQVIFGDKKIPKFDIANSDYILSFGSDFLSTWISPTEYAKAYGQFRQGNKTRGYLVQVESRFSSTAANADEWIYTKPGTEGILALSIAQVIISEGLADTQIINNLTNNDLTYLDQFAPSLIASKISDPSQNTEEVINKITKIAKELASHNNPLVIGGGSTAASTNGLFNLKNIYLLNYLIGSVNNKGGVILNPDPVNISDLRQTETSFSDWNELIKKMNNGDVKILLNYGSDPWYGLPDSAGFKDAIIEGNNGISNTSLIVSFSTIMDDIGYMSDLVLPPHHFLEDWGINTPNPAPGHEIVAFQQPVVRPFFENRGEYLGTKSFPNILLSISKDPNLNLNTNFEGEDYLSIIKSKAKNLFDSGKGTVGLKNTKDFASFESFWNSVLQHGFWQDTNSKYKNKKSHKLPQFDNLIEEPNFSSSENPNKEFYLIPFESYGLRDGIGNSSLPWLQALPDTMSTAVWKTWAEINAKVAKDMNIKEGDIIRIASNFGNIEAIAYPNPGTPTDVICVPLGQGHLGGGRFSEKRGANILSILAPLNVKTSGALAWASTKVNITNTGKWRRLPKFENDVSEFPTDYEQHIIKITRYDT